MMSLILRILVILALVASLSACSGRKATRGNLLTDSQIADIKVGETNRKTLVRLLGPPSTLGTFDSQVWYYIGRRTKQWAFMKPDVLEQKVVAIYFNDQGVVEHIERYGGDDARTVEIVNRETPTSGHSIGFFEQMMGNLGILRGNR